MNATQVMNFSEANDILTEAFYLNVQYSKELENLSAHEIQQEMNKKLNELKESTKKHLNLYEIFNIRVKILALELGKREFNLSSEYLNTLNKIEKTIKQNHPEVFI